MATIPEYTPAKRPFVCPSNALAEAIEQEWNEYDVFSPSAMPLTSLIYTAIDQVSDNKDNMIEVLMAYVDTDTLCYRSEKPDVLKEQKKQWDPVLAWAGDRYSALWQTTTGIMPVEQPEVLHNAIREHLAQLNEMQLTACGMLASGFSSLVLALAVLEKRLTADQAFALSQLEEELQAAQWGRDEEVDEKKQKMQAEIAQTSRFLSLLDGV